MTRLAAISALALGAALPVQAEVLKFPAEADLNTKRLVAEDSQFLPTAPYEQGVIDGIVAEGQVEQASWRVGDGGLTTLQILAPLRDQLISLGYTPLFECDTFTCGGFDFRFEIDVLPEPDMHVNLGDFRYFAGRRGNDAESEYVTLLVSRSARTGFVQLTHIGEAEATAAFTASTKTPSPDAPVVPDITGPIAEQLETHGHATLTDLTFRTGSSELGQVNFPSLRNLAAYLRANPDRTVMLVGHTDAEGALTTNITLSKRRADAVMERLIQQYDVSAAQLGAEGVGFLAPRASNLTPEGRTENRRVEVILTSTQ